MFKVYDNGSWLEISPKKYHSTPSALTSQYITATSGALTFGSIVGNTTQSTPTESTPVYPTSVGTLIDSGDDEGKYKLTVTITGDTAHTADFIYNAPLMKIDAIEQRPVGGADIITANGITRQIVKIELDGTESDWRKGGTGPSSETPYFVHSNLVSDSKNDTPILCSHFVQASIGSTGTDIGMQLSSTGGTLRVRPTNVSTMSVTDWTDWLAAQKLANTPVTVWYILDTALTEQITIPTLTADSGVNVVTYSTTPAPSSVVLGKWWEKMSAPKEYTNGSWQ